MVQHQKQPFELKTSKLAKDILEPNNEPWQVDLKDPAVSVMTDFRVRSMFKLEPNETIEDALHKMKVAGLRMAFVKEKNSEKLIGSITSYDIMGEKPMRYLQSVGFSDRSVTHKDILVRDIMEHTKDWEVIEIREVEKANVQNILEALQKLGRTHLPVLDIQDGKEPRLRGLFSSAQILRLTETSRHKASHHKA